MINADPISYSIFTAFICTILFSAMAATITMVTFPYVDPVITMFFDIFISKGIK